MFLLPFLGKRCRLNNFKIVPMRPSRISEWKGFSKSESLCYCDASYQVLAKSDLRFGRGCRLKILKMAAKAAILDIGTERF